MRWGGLRRIVFFSIAIGLLMVGNVRGEDNCYARLVQTLISCVTYCRVAKPTNFNCVQNCLWKYRDDLRRCPRNASTQPSQSLPSFVVPVAPSSRQSTAPRRVLLPALPTVTPSTPQPMPTADYYRRMRGSFLLPSQPTIPTMPSAPMPLLQGNVSENASFGLVGRFIVAIRSLF